MAKRINIGLDRSHPSYAARKELTMMVYRDIQAGCIMRGMDFDEVVQGDSPSLTSWFIKNHNNKMDRELLEDFDLWMDKQLKANGYKKSDPFRKFKRFSIIDDDNNIQIKTKSLSRARIPKKKREKKAKNSFGVYAGTKKSLTYDLVAIMYEKKKVKYTAKEMHKKYAPKIFDKVKAEFGDAKDKSVKMWMKRALDELDKEKGKA